MAIHDDHENDENDEGNSADSFELLPSFLAQIFRSDFLKIVSHFFIPLLLEKHVVAHFQI